MDDWPPVQLLEGDSGGVVLRNLRVFEVKSEEEALQLFFTVVLFLRNYGFPCVLI